jgi:hypothetical protein
MKKVKESLWRVKATRDTRAGLANDILIGLLINPIFIVGGRSLFFYNYFYRSMLFLIH